MQTTFAIQVQGDHWLVEWLIAFLASLAEEPITLLTMVLIAVTGFYAFATWKTFNVLKKDLEHRVQPIVDFEITQEELENGVVKLRLSVTSSNAPARLISAKGEAVWQEGPADEEGEPEYETQLIDFKGHWELPAIRGQIVKKDGKRMFETIIKAEYEAQYLSIELTYEDTVGIQRHKKPWENVFGEHPQVALKRVTWWRRLLSNTRSRWRMRRAIRKAKKRARKNTSKME